MLAVAVEGPCSCGLLSVLLRQTLRGFPFVHFVGNGSHAAHVVSFVVSSRVPHSSLLPSFFVPCTLGCYFSCVGMRLYSFALSFSFRVIDTVLEFHLCCLSSHTSWCPLRACLRQEHSCSTRSATCLLFTFAVEFPVPFSVLSSYLRLFVATYGCTEYKKEHHLNIDIHTYVCLCISVYFQCHAYFFFACGCRMCRRRSFFR